MFLARTGHAWEEANMHVHGIYKQNDVVRAMPLDLASNDSDSNSNSNNTAWEKAKEACKNVKDGIKSWAKNGKRKHSVDVEIVGGKVSGINENDGTTQSWNEIKEKADAIIEASKEYPGVRIDLTKEDPIIHLGMEKVDESGLLEPQHTLYDVFAEGADAANLEQRRKLSDVDTEVFQSGLLEPQHTLYNSFGDGIPEFVNKIETLDEGMVGTGPHDVKFPTTRRFSIKNENENDPHVYEATHESAGTVDLLVKVDDKEASFIEETLTDQQNGNLKTVVDDLRYMGV